MGLFPPLGVRLFRARVQLLGYVQANAELDPDKRLSQSLADGLHCEVEAMNKENFIVRMRLEAVEQFENRDAWEKLSENDRHRLIAEVASLPSEVGTDEIESRLFDLTALRMQLAHVEGQAGDFERYRRRVVEISALLEEKTSIPVVAAQLEYLVSLQEQEFWQDINLDMLEALRLRLRELVPFLDRKKTADRLH